MPKLNILKTVEGAFNLVRRDPAIIVLFVVPAFFPVERILGNFLLYYLAVSIAPNSFELPFVPQIPPIPFVVVYLGVGLFFGAWASASAILKVTGIEKRARLGLQESLSQGFRKIPILLVPAIVGILLYTLINTSLRTVFIPQLLTGICPPVGDMEPYYIPVRIVTGLLFIIGLYVATRLRLAAPACILEDNFGLSSSWRLVRGNWWRLFAILLIFGGISGLLSQIPVVGIFVSDLIVSPLTLAAVSLVYFQLAEANWLGK